MDERNHVATGEDQEGNRDRRDQDKKAGSEVSSSTTDRDQPSALGGKVATRSKIQKGD